MFESYPDVVRPQQLEDMLQIGRTKIYGLLIHCIVNRQKKNKS